MRAGRRRRGGQAAAGLLPESVPATATAHAARSRSHRHAVGGGPRAPVVVHDGDLQGRRRREVRGGRRGWVPGPASERCCGPASRQPQPSQPAAAPAAHLADALRGGLWRRLGQRQLAQLEGAGLKDALVVVPRLLKQVLQPQAASTAVGEERGRGRQRAVSTSGAAGGGGAGTARQAGSGSVPALSARPRGVAHRFPTAVGSAAKPPWRGI